MKFNIEEIKGLVHVYTGVHLEAAALHPFVRSIFVRKEEVEKGTAAAPALMIACNGVPLLDSTEEMVDIAVQGGLESKKFLRGGGVIQFDSSLSAGGTELTFDQDNMIEITTFLAATVKTLYNISDSFTVLISQESAVVVSKNAAGQGMTGVGFMWDLCVSCPEEQWHNLRNAHILELEAARKFLSPGTGPLDRNLFDITAGDLAPGRSLN